MNVFALEDLRSGNVYMNHAHRYKRFHMHFKKGSQYTCGVAEQDFDP
jgi:hypothetical protein